ncbi:ABC transporter ATP-binding protein [Roseomonas sp. NAR14]|uniref:ABC transporter ATP-binding protein n=1 Tax=Roseomonas acroporae TaxID=2937791 RepID=A0A9X2BUU2_9PROT|nr:ABC transporter ATP-binding protein [Roseomonas acroporae]MCK8783329.1 ABC transporter ATP-binding protein [Roseomonas acroporae]
MPPDSANPPGAAPPLVHARDLTVRFVTRDATVHAVNGVDFDLAQGEVLCILGESGSGKSVTLRALMRLNPPGVTRVSGTLRVGGHDMVAASARAVADLRGGLVSMIFQEPMTALDPIFTIGRQIRETILRHEKVSGAEADRRALELLELVQIPSAKRRLAAYPHELSGGLRQRAMIAIALSCRPKLLLADEPTTALDATVQIQILLLLRQLQRELGMGVVFVTHDLGVAGEIADRIAVMYAGRFIEEGPTGALMRAPLHPYAQGLLGATVHGQRRGTPLTTIPGSPPNLERLPEGCAFAPRCPYTEPACLAAVPAPRRPVPDRAARCIRVPDTAQPPAGIAA